ncbi:MAG: M28 family peptidase [Chloroflexi bacterium]|nr:M28 family peptidase [Chloroflexota bacterium]
MLTRLLLLSLTFALLLVACRSDDATQPVVVQTTEQVEQATEQQSEQPTRSDPSDRAEDPTDSRTGQQGQAAQQEETDPDEPPSQPVEQEDQPQSLPLRPGGPPEPDFDYDIAVGYLNHLAGTLGPRASGTEQERAAADYLAETFTSLGYEVEIQGFDYTTQAGISRIDTPDGYRSFAFRFPGSADNSVSGELVNVEGFGEPADFASVDVRGKVAIVDRGLIEFREKGANAVAAGAVALIVANRTLSETIGGTLGTDTSAIPLLQVSEEAGDELRSRLGTIVSIPQAAPNKGESQNVIARKPGGACRVVVGGHYDTVPEVDGANDNASGTALTLALAEIWSEHPSANDICFAGFGAEELGLHGSRYFVRQLRAEDDLSHVTSMLNLDAIGDGRPSYRIVASFQLQDITGSVAAELQINAGSGSPPRNLGSDHSSFANVGIPVVFVFPPGAILHTPLDNLDNINHELFEDISRLNHGILACLLERAGSPISPTISCGAE